jgi:RNA polymerase sporulation-specific sigma factor
MVLNKENNINDIIESNLTLVHFIINKYHKNIVRTINSRGLAYDDLFQIGCVGLVKAANNFDEDLGYTFSTYAKHVISNEIKMFFRDHNTTIKFSRLAKIAALQVKDEKDVTIEMIIERANCTLNTATQALYYINNLSVRSLDEKLYDGDTDDTCLIDTIESYDDDLDFKIIYDDFLNTLNERRRMIARFLTSGFNQTEISKIIGISQPHVNREVQFIRNAIKEYKGGELCIL